MKSTTIEISDELDERLNREAARSDISVAKLIQEVLEQHVSPQPRYFRMEGVGNSGESDLSQRVDEILAAEWGDYIDPEERRSSQRSSQTKPKRERRPDEQ